MYDSWKILIGLILFLGIFTFPLWYNPTVGEIKKEPGIVLPPASKGTECVKSTNEMRISHMNLLNDWRDEVVRRGRRDYTSFTGKKFEMSLSKTCLNCHSNKSEFCDKCHNYLGVNPYCWNCHVEPQEMENQNE